MPTLATPLGKRIRALEERLDELEARLQVIDARCANRLDPDRLVAVATPVAN